MEILSVKLAAADLLTACSVLIAMVTWHVSHRRDIQAKRVEYTAEVIAALSTSERLAASSFVVTRLINDGARLSMETIAPDVEPHVVDVLDYYEFMCDLYTKEVVDRKTIVQLRGRLMRRTWQTCEAYIRDTGERQNRRIYEGFEHFVHNLPPDDSPEFTATAPRPPWKRILRLWTSLRARQAGRPTPGG